MTLLPAENRDVVGLEGPLYPRYRVGPLCSVPSCSRFADHAHHIWRRSFLAGDYAWVKLWDGTIVQNLTGLCHAHHHLVTVNEAVIEYTRSGSFVWFVVTEATEPTKYLLDPPPLRWGSLTVDGPTMKIGDVVHEHGPGAVEKCPTCARAMPGLKTKKEGKRHREKWSITVPMDEREKGADVLDILLGECAVLFGHDEDAKAVRYFTLVQALALVVQHGAQMMSDA